MSFTTLRWAVDPADINRIEQLPGISRYVAPGIPAENQLITHPFLVDPVSKQPIPVFVRQVLFGYPTPDAVTIVVTRPQ